MGRDSATRGVTSHVVTDSRPGVLPERNNCVRLHTKFRFVARRTKAWRRRQPQQALCRHPMPAKTNIFTSRSVECLTGYRFEALPPLLLRVQAAEVATQLLTGHATDENQDTIVNSSNPNVPDNQVGSSHVSTVMPNQPALPRAGSHGAARCSAAWSLRGVRRSCGTRQGESLADCWGHHRPHPA